MPTLRSKTYFAAGRRIVRAGDLLPSTDPIVKGRESLFENVDDHVAQKSAPKKATKAVKKAAPKADADAQADEPADD